MSGSNHAFGPEGIADARDLAPVSTLREKTLALVGGGVSLGEPVTMTIPTIGRRAALSGLASLAISAPAGAVAETAAIAVDVANGRCVVPVTFDRQIARMLLDTGAERSVITLAAAKRLRLKFDPWVDTTMRGAGGRLDTHANADVSAAAIGGIPIYQRRSLLSLSLAVTTLDLGDVDGLLGGDILQHHTLDLDFTAAILTLGLRRAALPSHSVRLRLLWPDLLLAPVVLDGRGLTALVDTGSSASLINARGLHRLGLTPARIAAGRPMSSLSLGGRLNANLYPFAGLRIGPLVIRNPAILAAEIPEAAFDMILGLDVLGRQRLLLSYADLTLALG